MEQEAVIIERLNNLISSVEKEEKNSAEWRSVFCLKLDKLFSLVDTLPCSERREITKAIIRDISWLQKITYTALCLIVPALLGLGITWGNAQSTIEHNKVMIEKLERQIKP